MAASETLMLISQLHVIISLKQLSNFNPLIPMPPITRCDEHWPLFTSDVITFAQNWLHLYSTSAGGKDFSNDTQIRVTGSKAPEICMKMLRNLSGKLTAKFLRNLSRKVRAKFPATCSGYSMAKVALLNNAFVGLF